MYKGIKSENIEDIREILVENSNILQKNGADKISNSNDNFHNSTTKLKYEKNEKFKDKYYDPLKHINNARNTKSEK